MKQTDQKLNLIKENFKQFEGTNEAYGRLIHRKRLEQGKTLEALASGVCSTSYLCRIENAQVEVEDDFLSHLFEKLEVSYEEVKQNINVDIYKELLVKYLQDDVEGINKLALDAANKSIYSQIELSIINLIYLISNNRYDDCKDIIVELDKSVSLLVGKELIIFTYLSALYAFKINNVLTAYRFIRVLLGINYEDLVLKELVYDLSLNIFSLLDEDVLFLDSYFVLRSNKILKSSALRNLNHEIEFTLTIGKHDYNKGIDGFKELYDNCIQYDNLEYYYYCFMKFYLFYNKFDNAVELYNKSPKSARIINLLDYIMLNHYDFYKVINYIHELKNFKFGKYESFHLFYNEFTIKKLERLNNFEIVDFIKINFFKNKLSNNELKNCMIVKNIYYNYLYANYDMGKYKESSKFALNFFKN